MKQRIKRDDREWESDESRPILLTRGPGHANEFFLPVTLVDNDDKPAPKESGRLWESFHSIYGSYPAGREMYRKLADAIKAEVKEEIYFDLKMRGIDK